jgi:hypothetical protein
LGSTRTATKSLVDGGRLGEGAKKSKKGKIKIKIIGCGKY